MELDPELIQFPGPTRLPSRLRKNYFSFAIVRNPIDRALSLWRQKVLSTPEHGAKIWNLSLAQMEELRNLDAFVTWLEKQDLDRGETHIRSQASFIPRDVSYLGRMETISEDWSNLLEKTGIVATAPLQHKNKTKKGTGQELTEEQLTRIIRLYRQDVLRFYPELLANENSKP